MNGRRTRFELIEGKITLTVEKLVWGEWLEVIREDVTDKVMPVVDDYLDENLGLKDYKNTNGKISYTGKDKDKYEK